MKAFRRRLKPIAYLTSLLVIAAALWMPSSAIGQALPGSPFGSGDGASSVTFLDSVFRVQDNGDTTKQFAFQVSGVTAGNTRTATVPNTDFTMAGINIAQSWTAAQTFGNDAKLSFGASGGGFIFSTNPTPDTVIMTTNNVANSFVVAETGDTTFDWAHANQTHPTIFIHSTNQSTTEFTGYTYLGATPSRNTVTVDTATTFAVTSAYVVLACTGAETINTITGGLTGMELILEHTDTECTIADDDDATAANAVDLTGAATNDVGAVNKVIKLLYNGTYWLQMSESDN